MTTACRRLQSALDCAGRCGFAILQRVEEHKECFPHCVKTPIKDIVITEVSAGS